jgi:hypothetical protein
MSLTPIGRAPAQPRDPDDHLAPACAGDDQSCQIDDRVDRAEKPVSHILPAEVRLHILHHAEMAPIHSAWMAATLAHHGYRVCPDMMNPVMYHMQGENLLIPDRQVADGRLRRVYDITAHGIWALDRPEFIVGLGEIKIDG